jgi:hypothetical protein
MQGAEERRLRRIGSNTSQGGAIEGYLPKADNTADDASLMIRDREYALTVSIYLLLLRAIVFYRGDYE